MDNDWFVFGIPFAITVAGTAVILGVEGLGWHTSIEYLGFDLLLVVGMFTVVLGILLLAGGIYRLPEPEGTDESGH